MSAATYWNKKDMSKRKKKKKEWITVCNESKVNI